MNEQCNKCYYKSLGEDKCIRGVENISGECDRYVGYCEVCDNGEQEEYELDGVKYCTSCLMKELGIQTYSFEYYEDANGEYLGDENDDMIDVLRKENLDIKEL